MQFVVGEADLTYDGFYDIGHMKPGKPLMCLSHYCSQPVNTRRPILFVNTGTLSSVATDICFFLRALPIRSIVCNVYTYLYWTNFMLVIWIIIVSLKKMVFIVIRKAKNCQLPVSMHLSVG